MTLLWQSPYQVYTTLETTYIGVVAYPFLSKDLVYEWFALEEGEERFLGLTDPFILVPPGRYTCKLSYMGEDEVVLQGYISRVNVLKCSNLFQGETL